LARGRAVDDRAIGQDIEQAGLRPRRNPSEPRIPFTEHDTQFIAQLAQVTEMRFQVDQSRFDQRANAATGRPSTIALGQRDCQIIEREANRQCTPHEPDASDCLGWVSAIPALAARRNGKHPLAFVVPQCVRADTGQSCELGRAEQRGGGGACGLSFHGKRC
jgi:hypothetical protein